MIAMVTGAHGFIGGHLCHELRKPNGVFDEIHPIGRNMLSYPEVNLSVENVVKQLYELILPDVVFHLAANPMVKPDESNPTGIIQDNIVATQNICHFAPRGTRIIFASSIVVYGDKTIRVSETECCRPTSVYGATKLASEGIIHAYHKMGHIQGTSLRLGATVGTGLTHGVIYDFVKKLQLDSPYLEVFGDCPGACKPFNHVDDVVQAFMLMASEEVITQNLNSVYNVIPEDELTVEDIANTVMEVIGIKKKIKWLGSKSLWKGDNKALQCKNQRLKYRGWKPKYETSKEAVAQAVREIIA